MDEASRLFHTARERHADLLVDLDQRNHDRRERVLLAIGAWYSNLHQLIPAAMRAESKSVSSATEGNVGSYQEDFLGPEFTARVETYVGFDLDDDNTLSYRAIPPQGFSLPGGLSPDDLVLHVSIFPYANLHSIGPTENAAGSAGGTYRMDQHGVTDLTAEHVVAILKQATESALSRE